MEKPYILAWWLRGFELIGPFESEDAANKWARTIGPAPHFKTLSNPNNPRDTPCWQVLLLTPEETGVFKVDVRSPDSGPLRNFR